MEMPEGAQILSIAEQHDQLAIWALATPENAKKTRHIRVHGTGHRIATDPGKFIGTVQLLEGMRVLHFFDAGELPAKEEWYGAPPRGQHDA
jgi:hypothetical protein